MNYSKCFYFIHLVDKYKTCSFFRAVLSSISLLKILQGVMEGIWEAFHRLPRLLKPHRLLWCSSMCQGQFPADPLHLARILALDSICYCFVLKIYLTIVVVIIVITCPGLALGQSGHLVSWPVNNVSHRLVSLVLEVEGEWALTCYENVISIVLRSKLYTR